MTNPTRADEVWALALRISHVNIPLPGERPRIAAALREYADLLDRQEDNMGPVSAQAGATQVDGRGTPTAGSNPARPPDRQKARCPACGGRGRVGVSVWDEQGELETPCPHCACDHVEARCAPLLEFVDEMGCWPFDSRIRVKARDALRAFREREGQGDG